MNNPAKFTLGLLAPKLWPSWLAFALWWLLAQLLPLPIQLYLGRKLGDLLYKYARSRRHIAEVNIARCYPELSPEKQQALVKRTIQETAIGIIESGIAWFWPNWRFKGKYQIIGLEHIERAKKNGKGVLFLGTHFTTIEIGATIANLAFPISGFYRPHTNAVYEYIQAVGRIRRNTDSRVIDNENVRGIIKALRSGACVNYAPDQDYGERRSVFAPFFNIQTATVKAPAQLASAGKAEVIPWVTRREPETNKYIVEILPPITEQLGNSDYEDAVVINTFIEQQVRRNTEQYLWVHRRFKTRPKDEAGFYK